MSWKGGDYLTWDVTMSWSFTSSLFLRLLSNTSLEKSVAILWLVGPCYFLEDKTIGDCAMVFMDCTLAGGPQCRHRGGLSFEGICCVVMISCVMTCESVYILLFMSLRQSRGVLVVGWKIFVDSFGFGGKECAAYGDQFCCTLWPFVWSCLWAFVLAFFQMLQLFLSMHEQLCGLWG